MYDAIVGNPVYFGIVLTCLGLAGGALSSWLFTFFYFKKSQSRKLLCYTTRDSDYLGYNRADFNNLSVHYGDKKLANPVRYTLYVWNCGNVTINGADISNVDPLAFGKNGIEILETAPIWSTRDSINPKLLIDSNKMKIAVEFDFLDPDDGFAIQFLADRPNQPGRWHPLQAYGTVKGLHRAPFHVAAGFERASWWQKYVATAAIAFFAFSTVAIGYDAWQSGMVITSLIKFLAAVIFALITIAVIGMTFEGFGSRSFVIPSLLRKTEEDSDDAKADDIRARLGARLIDSGSSP